MLRRILLRSALTKSANRELNNVCNFPKVFLPPAASTHTSNISQNHKHAAAETPGLSEREFLVKVKHDPDTFGAVGDEELEADLGDLAEERFLEEQTLPSQKLSTKQYADIIKSFLRKRKIKEAIDVVEVRMLKEDKVKPENYIYNLLIGACGRVGYTKKAFSLYNQMKKRALVITPGTYTALFNACANSPWPTTDGLVRARHLRSIMIEKMYEPNLLNYNAMIKAFGRGGDLETAFALVDEMTAKKFTIKDDTINFLLQACISDQEAGFRHALLVWRKFVQKNIAPSTISYNLMLRCIRDCGLGDIEVTTDIINQLVQQEQPLLKDPNQTLIGSSDNGDTALTIVQNNETLNKPNLMARIPHLGNILSLKEVTQPEDRLLLVGGSSGFLQNMAENSCTPDVKTFTQLLDNIPGTIIAEKELLQTLRKNKIKPDIDFFNMLIKKRSMRFDYESAKEVLAMIKEANMRPNLITYGVLALGCKTKAEAESLLDEMAEAHYRINIEILGAMLKQACCHINFPYIMYVMDICVSENISPSSLFLENLNNFKKKSKHISNNSNDPLSKSTAYQKGYRIFKMKYKTWLEQVQVDDPEDAHPWQQYRQTTNTNVRHYKDKEEKVRFKPVHISLFRQKKRVQNVNKK